MGFLVCFAVLGLFCLTGLPEVNAITNMQFVTFAIENGAEMIGENQSTPYEVISLPGKINDPLNLTALLNPVEERFRSGMSLRQLESGCRCDKSSCMCSFSRTIKVAGLKFTLTVSAIAIFQKNYTEAELKLTVNGRTLVDKTISINLQPFCFKVPFIPLKVALCGQLYGLDVEKKKVCVKAYVEINLFIKTIIIDLVHACMTIPIFLEKTSEIMTRADVAQRNGNLVELFEMLQQEDYSLIGL